MRGIQFSVIALAVCISITTAYAGNPSKAGDITGRSLAVTGLGSIGHIGTWNGSQVVEVLNESRVIQFNTLTKFKNSSSYWGARGNANFANPSSINVVANTQSQYSPSYTLVPLNTKIGRIEQQCTKRNMLGQCVTYSNVRVNAVVRCDTFVNYIYQATGNGSLSSLNVIYPFIAYSNAKIERT